MILRVKSCHSGVIWLGLGLGLGLELGLGLGLGCHSGVICHAQG